MIEMKIAAASRSTLRLEWVEPDGATCWAHVYRSGDGSINRPTEYCRTSVNARMHRRSRQPVSSWRSFGAITSTAERDAMNKLVDATDCGALLDQFAADERDRTVEYARQARIKALKGALELIGRADRDDLAAAVLNMPVDVARLATRLNQEWDS